MYDKISEPVVERRHVRRGPPREVLSVWSQVGGASEQVPRDANLSDQAIPAKPTFSGKVGFVASGVRFWCARFVPIYTNSL